MTKRDQQNVTDVFEQALKGLEEEKYFLRLYVAGMSMRSTRAIANINEICEEQLHGRYEIEVVDIHQSPDLVVGEQIIAVPTLIKELPLPLRRIIGDLSNKEQVLVGLELSKKK